MLPLQWVAYGLLLVVADLAIDDWDVLADPVGWAVVLVGVVRLRHVLGAGVRWSAVVSLAVSVATWPPGLLEPSAPLAWAASLPQVVFTAWLALDLARALPERRRSLRAIAGLSAVLGVAPPVVLVTGSATLVVLLAGVAVITMVWLVVLLFLAARELPAPVPAR